MIAAFEQAGKENILNKKYQVWQNFNFPTLLDNPFLIDQKTNYIYMNPVVAGFVSEPFEYYYSSANPNSPLNIFNT